MNLPEQPFRAFDGTRFATARDRRLWNLWLATVALIIVGSLVAWLLIIRSPVQGPTARSTDARTAQATAGENTSFWSRYTRHTTPAPPAAGPGIVWVNTRSKVYHYPGYNETEIVQWRPEGKPTPKKQPQPTWHDLTPLQIQELWQRQQAEVMSKYSEIGQASTPANAQFVKMIKALRTTFPDLVMIYPSKESAPQLGPVNTSAERRR